MNKILDNVRHCLYLNYTDRPGNPWLGRSLALSLSVGIFVSHRHRNNRISFSALSFVAVSVSLGLSFSSLLFHAFALCKVFVSFFFFARLLRCCSHVLCRKAAAQNKNHLLDEWASVCQAMAIARSLTPIVLSSLLAHDGSYPTSFVCWWLWWWCICTHSHTATSKAGRAQSIWTNTSIWWMYEPREGSGGRWEGWLVGWLTDCMRLWDSDEHIFHNDCLFLILLW